MEKNVLIDLSHAKTVASLLARCGLPFTPFTGYVLKDTLRAVAAQRMASMSASEIRARFPNIPAVNVSRAALLDHLFPYAAKDVDVLEYNLGRPVSVAEANRVFLESRVDIDKVPKYQRDLVNTQGNTVTDLITLEERPLSEFIQLCVTGELVTRETFQDLVRRGTTRWMGEESVGFKTPGMGAISSRSTLTNKTFFPRHRGPCRYAPCPTLPRHRPRQTLPVWCRNIFSELSTGTTCRFSPTPPRAASCSD